MSVEVEHYGVARWLPGSTVLDVGASRGQFAIPALTAGAAAVWAVEPLPENVAVLRSLADGRPNLRVLSCAVGPRSGLSALIVPDDPAVTATGSYTAATSPSHDDVLVPTLTLDWLLFTRAEWDVVKVDVEGAEYATFAAADALGCVRCFTIDTHHWTTGDEPRLHGIGHHAYGPRYEPGDFDRLVEKLRTTHDVTLLGPHAPGVTLLAVRR